MDYKYINADFITELREAVAKNNRFKNYYIDKMYIKKADFFRYYTGAEATPADFDPKTQKYICLYIEYPSEHYAEPLYIPVKTLEKLYTNTEGGTVAEWIENILNFIEV